MTSLFSTTSAQYALAVLWLQVELNSNLLIIGSEEKCRTKLANLTKMFSFRLVIGVGTLS